MLNEYHMGITAENVLKNMASGREEQDALALESGQNEQLQL